MDLIELRPSYSEQFRQSYRFINMSPEDKREYLEEQLKVEEEKAEVQKYLNQQKAQKAREARNNQSNIAEN